MAARNSLQQQRSRRSCLAALLGSALVGTLGPAAPTVHARPGTPVPPELASELPNARWQGSATMRFLGMRVYEARLWSPATVTGDSASQPLALELVYARSIESDLIVSSSLREMQRIGSFSDAQSARWSKAMGTLFPDVASGDRITGVQRPGQSARFYFNGALRGEIADAEFARLFFGIWLSPRTSEPQLRQQLLGAAS